MVMPVPGTSDSRSRISSRLVSGSVTALMTSSLVESRQERAAHPRDRRQRHREQQAAAASITLHSGANAKTTSERPPAR